jgi:hypothetical protein
VSALLSRLLRDLVDCFGLENVGLPETIADFLTFSSVDDDKATSYFFPSRHLLHLSLLK